MKPTCEGWFVITSATIMRIGLTMDWGRTRRRRGRSRAGKHLLAELLLSLASVGCTIVTPGVSPPKRALQPTRSQFDPIRIPSSQTLLVGEGAETRERGSIARSCGLGGA